MENNTLQIYTTALQMMGPEIAVVVAVIFAALWNLFQPRSRSVTPWMSIILMAVACLMYGAQFGMSGRQILFPAPGGAGGGLFVVDKLTIVFGVLSCLTGIIVTLMTMGFDRHFGNNRGEFYCILNTAVLAVMLLAGTTDLVLLFVALETLTICCVLLAGFQKKERKSNEASLKYLLSTAATTATFLYGLSFLYGMTGSTNYSEIIPRITMANQSPTLVLVFLIVLLISVIGFKLSMVPFHMWTPDVYEGAPTPVSAFLSVGSKMGGFVVAIRLLTTVFGSAVNEWQPILGVLAIVSMVMGNFIALAQTSLKRMLAYSSIAHVGYLLIGLTANSAEGLSAMIFYLMIYGFMNLGAFAAAIIFEDQTGTDNIEEMSGLIRKRPWLAVCLSICLLNLGGLPVPPAGFLAKVFIFWSGFQMYSTLGNWMVIIALLTSVPAVYYYTRVCINMIVREPSSTVAALPDRRPPQLAAERATGFALALAIAGIVAGTVLVNPLMTFSNDAVSSLGRPAAMGSLPNNIQ